jgi:hypothetical protein
MSARPTPRFTGLAIAIVVAGLVVGGIYVSPYFGKTVTMTSTATTTSTTTVVSTASANEGPLSYASGVSPDGLQLKVTLNSSSIQSHGALTAHIEILNMQSRNVSLAVVTNPYASDWDGVDFVCSSNPSHSLVGFALFKGHLSAANISAAGSPLQLAPPVYPPCAFRLGPNETTFLPNSDQTISSSYYDQAQQPSYPVTAELNATTGSCVGSGLSGHGGSVDCGTSPGLLGYWNPGTAPGGDLNFTSPAFSYFPRGEYTIVATDDWNQYVYAYFTVL